MISKQKKHLKVDFFNSDYLEKIGLLNKKFNILTIFLFFSINSLIHQNKTLIFLISDTKIVKHTHFF